MSAATALKEAQSIAPWIIDVRRQLHRIPELKYEEVKTSALVQATLKELGISFQTGLAETGVVATVGPKEGPCVALRADMDGLPIEEAVASDFRSTHSGRMHACGHDCHTAMLLGAAKLLKQRESTLTGPVKLIFQPAEEGGAGAERMCQAGVLDSPRVQRIFGLHVWSLIPTGTIGGKAGTFLAAAGELDIIIRGKGGHAAMPHLARDPVTTAAQVITALQTIISRELDPLSAGVISITMVHGGAAYNVIPEEVRLHGTIRSLTLTGLKALQARVTEVATNVAAAQRCSAEVSFPGNDYPPTDNDPHAWELSQQIGRDLLGATSVKTLEPVMGGEDFAYYVQNGVPGCFVALGIRNEALGSVHSVHTPQFLVDESALPIGTAMHVEFAMRSQAELAGMK